MKCYLIACIPNATGEDLQVAEAIKKFPRSCRLLDSVWTVKSDWPVKQVRDQVKAHIGTDGGLLVVELSGEGAWAGLNDEAVAWLVENL